LIYDNGRDKKIIYQRKEKDLHEELFLLEESTREIDLWLENKRLIKESMDLYVKDANYDKLETLDEIAWKIESPIWKYLKSLPQDQLRYFEKNKVQSILTSDGPYYDSPTGILNFYTVGLTRNAFIGVMKIIFDGLKKLGISYGKVKKENSGTYKSEVIRIPILKNPHSGTYKGPPSLNLTNVNAYQIFHNLLQYEGEHEFHMKAKELIERIQTLIAHDKGWIDKNTINRTDSRWPKAERDDQDIENPHIDVINKLGQNLGGATIIGMGLSSEDIKRKLSGILEVARWAVKNGYEDLYVA